MRDCANICGVVPRARAGGRRAGAVRRADGARVLSERAPSVPAGRVEPRLRRSRAPSQTAEVARPGRVVRRMRDVEAADDSTPSRAARSMRGWRLHGLDLRGSATSWPARGRRRVVPRLHVRPGDAERPRGRRRWSCSRPPDVPVDAYRAALYTADELYARRALRRLPRRPGLRLVAAPVDRDALARPGPARPRDRRGARGWVAGRRLVGVMGGHALERGSRGVRRRRRLGWLLGRPTGRDRRRPGCDGGGQPRRRLAASADAVLDDALERLAAAPSYHPSVDAWVRAGDRGARRRLAARDTLGVPTWFYGHEPPNVFATAIAKYFRNAIREAILLRGLRRGIVFLPGAGGTVQEIFQDACENYYADESRSRRWCSSAAATGPRPCPRGRCCGRWPRGRAMEPTSTWSTRSTRRPCWSRRWLRKDAVLAQACVDSIAASWPQAPSISRPRVSRTVVGMPFASSRRTNSRSSPGRRRSTSSRASG